MARAAAPMRRRLCQVKAAQGEPARRERRECCKACFDVAKGPPEEVAAVGRVQGGKPKQRTRCWCGK